VWIVRDITITNWSSGGALQGVNACSITLNAIPMVSTPQLRSVRYFPYRWRDIRIALKAGDVWQASSSDVYWSWLITGYQLSA
jgi:hypothetical protein